MHRIKSEAGKNTRSGKTKYLQNSVGKAKIQIAQGAQFQNSDMQEDKYPFQTKQELNEKLVKGRLVMMFVQKDERGFLTDRITILPAIKTGSEIITTN